MFGIDEDVLMEVVFEVGVDDVMINEDGFIEVISGFVEFILVKEVLEKVGFKVEVVEVMMCL